MLARYYPPRAPPIVIGTGSTQLGAAAIIVVVIAGELAWFHRIFTIVATTLCSKRFVTGMTRAMDGFTWGHPCAFQQAAAEGSLLGTLLRRLILVDLVSVDVMFVTENVNFHGP